MKTKIPKKPVTPRRSTAAKKSPEILRILATTDFSEESRMGVRFARSLATKLNAAITLLHVVEPAPRVSGLESVILVREDSKQASLVQTRLNHFVEEEGKGGVPVDALIRNGKAYEEIATVARQLRSDMIILATHGYTGVDHVLLGSTAERVVRHAPCPVLTVPARTEGRRKGKTPSFKIERIVVPIDFSDLSKDAVPWATLLAGQFDAEILLLHVVEKFPIDYLLGSELMNQTVVPMLKQAESDLEALAQNLAESTGLKVSSLVRQGKPFEQICEASKTEGADLIILTTHGYTGLKRVWLGSTAERVVRHATCPVLALREKARTAL